MKDNNFKIKEVCDNICEELCPFDISDEESLLIEDRLERLEKVSRTLTAKVSRVSKAFKEKKFRRHPEQLKEKKSVVVSTVCFSLPIQIKSKPHKTKI